MSSESLTQPLHFPISAIVGMDIVKKALICALINPKIKCVLIRGDSGIAKTTISRSISGNLSEMKIINIPLNVTSEQLFGGLNIEETLKKGSIEIQKGLLSKSDGNLTFIDDINLLDQKVLSAILECIISKKVIVERESVSTSYECNTTLIATMNPEHIDLSSHVLDRFDICAYAVFPEDLNEREEILRRNMEYIRDPKKLISDYYKKDEDISNTIKKAKEILPLVTISDELISIIVDLCIKVGAQGYRGSISMLNTSMALAAMNSRDEVTKKDIEEAAELCLPHRRDYTPPAQPPAEPPNSPEDEKDSDESSEDDNNQSNLDQSPPKDNDLHDNLPKNDDNLNKDENKDEKTNSPEEQIFEIGDQFIVKNYLGDRPKQLKNTKSRKGKRDLVESGDNTGRYSRSRIPNNTVIDVAFDATIRAAAPHQRERHSDSLSIVIEKQDIREKIRERRCGCTIMFVVDASGSLGVRKRMTTVKGAILSMLRDSYVKRDRLGMIAFRRDSAELILPPTKSVEYGYKQLETLPTGGKTPLGKALLTSSDFMTTYIRSHQEESCCVVMITDGRANVPVKEGTDANKEAREIAQSISVPGLRWIIVDASTDFIHFDNAKNIANDLKGTYLKLENLNADTFAKKIRSAIDE